MPCHRRNRAPSHRVGIVRVTFRQQLGIRRLRQRIATASCWNQELHCHVVESTQGRSGSSRRPQKVFCSPSSIISRQSQPNNEDIMLCESPHWHECANPLFDGFLAQKDTAPIHVLHWPSAGYDRRTSRHRSRVNSRKWGHVVVDVARDAPLTL